MSLFRTFNLDFFRALIQQKSIGSMHIVLAAPPIVLGQSFETLQVLLTRNTYRQFINLLVVMSHEMPHEIKIKGGEPKFTESACWTIFMSNMSSLYANACTILL